jgi:hypothetical protein
MPEVRVGLTRSARLLVSCLILGRPRTAVCSILHIFRPKGMLLSRLHLARRRRFSPPIGARRRDFLSVCSRGESNTDGRHFLRHKRFTDTEH